jgi:hypothetical protein
MFHANGCRLKKWRVLIKKCCFASCVLSLADLIILAIIYNFQFVRVLLLQRRYQCCEWEATQ